MDVLQWFTVANFILSLAASSSTVSPICVWPLTDMYADPGYEVNGSGNNGVLHNVQTGEAYPGTNVRVTRFLGSATSYVEMEASSSLSVTDFTFEVYVKIDSLHQGPIFAWDTNSGMFGTHIWIINNALFFRPTLNTGAYLQSLTLSGIQLGKWQMIHVSYRPLTADVCMCIDSVCNQMTVGEIVTHHYTTLPVRVGKKTGDTRYYNGQMACAVLFNQYIGCDVNLGGAQASITRTCFGYGSPGISGLGFVQIIPQRGGGSMASTKYASSILDCAIYCLKFGCKSFVWNIFTKVCTVHSTVESPDDIVISNEVKYFRFVA